jgi:hypothetical protein
LETAGEDTTGAASGAVHNGVQARGAPAQFLTPVASYDAMRSEAMYSTSFTTAGDGSTGSAVVAVHNGEHTFGLPPQPELPAPSNAYNFPSFEPMNTTLLATVGDESVTGCPTFALHSAAHVFGGPATQLLFPAASNAYSFPSLDPA